MHRPKAKSPARRKRLTFLHQVPYLILDRVFLTTAPYARQNALVLTARKTAKGTYTDFVPLMGRWPSRPRLSADLLKPGSRIRNLARYGLVETSRPEIVSANLLKGTIGEWK